MDPVSVGAIAVLVGAGILGQVKLYGKYSQRVEDHEKEISGKGGLAIKMDELTVSVVALKQQLKHVEGTLNDGLIEKVDNLTKEFAEMRGSVKMFIKMQEGKRK